MTDVEKSEIYPVFGSEICCVAIYAIFRVISFVSIYAALHGKKMHQHCNKNNKYEVWLRLAIAIACPIFATSN